MLNFAAQYKCKNVKSQAQKEHLMQEQNMCTYNHAQKPEA